MKHDRKRNDTTLGSLSLSCHSVNWKWQEKKWSVRCQDKKMRKKKLYKTATKLVFLQRKVIVVGIFRRGCNCFIFRSSSWTRRCFKTNESSLRRDLHRIFYDSSNDTTGLKPHLHLLKHRSLTSFFTLSFSAFSVRDVDKERILG